MSDTKRDSFSAFDLSELFTLSRTARQLFESSLGQHSARTLMGPNMIANAFGSKELAGIHSAKALAQLTDAFSAQLFAGVASSYRLFEALQMSPALGPATRGLFAGYESLSEVIRGEFLKNHSMVDASRWMTSDRGALSTYSTLLEAFSAATVDPGQLGAFQKTFGGAIFQGLDQVAVAPDQVALEEKITSLEETVENLAARLPAGWLSREGVLGIIVTILVFMIQLRLDQQSEQRVLERMDEMNNRLHTVVEKLDDARRATNPHVVRQAVRVRQRPSVQGEILGVLLPGIPVEVLEGEAGWLRVRYFDPVSGEITEGWAVRRCFKPR